MSPAAGVVVSSPSSDVVVHKKCRELGDKSSSCIKMQKAISKELEEVKQRNGSSSSSVHAQYYPFPEASLKFLRSIPGNNACVDCGAQDPQWASISYGVLVCLKCSGRHRSFGVSHSIVKSLQLDTWEHSLSVLKMLEGGNAQWNRFLSRHGMNDNRDRVYFTKAALFYRENLHRHAEKVIQAGVYHGRHVWRERRKHASPTTNDNRSQQQKKIQLHHQGSESKETALSEDGYSSSSEGEEKIGFAHGKKSTTTATPIASSCARGNLMKTLS
jgi:hypothetical protein